MRYMNLHFTYLLTYLLPEAFSEVMNNDTHTHQKYFEMAPAYYAHRLHSHWREYEYGYMT